jgi:hypothetical protein
MKTATTKYRPEKLMMRIVKGGMQPADNYTTTKLRARNYAMGEIVAAQITKPRNPKFWRLAHGLGSMVAENIDSFAGMDSHCVIKRLQREALIACDEFAFMVPGCGIVTQYTPRSLSFESMSAEEFDSVYKQICSWLVKHYWPSQTNEQIEEMALLLSCD